MNRKDLSSLRLGWVLWVSSVPLFSALTPSWAHPQLETSSSVPAQLNILGFAGCLKDALPEPQTPIAFRALKTHHRLGSTDGLLLFLSVYPGVRPAGQAGWAIQQSAHHYWQTAFEPTEELFLDVLLQAAEEVEQRLVFGQSFLTPGRVFQAALEACRMSPPLWRQNPAPASDPLCAAVVAHNVFRTLGRSHRAVAVDPWSRRQVDLNPTWFKSDRFFWKNRIPYIQSSLIALRADGQGDRYGEWYHFFGILAFGLRDYAVNKNITQTRIAARMNQVLNPILAGGEEEPEKARLDRDSAEVVALLTSPRFRPYVSGCDHDAARYVNEIGSQSVLRPRIP